MHVKKRDDVLIEGAVVFELIGEVEDHVRLEALQFLPQQIEVVEDGEMRRFMTKFTKRGEDVRLGLTILGPQLGPHILVERGGRDGVE